MKNKFLHLIAIMCIYLVTTITLVQAFSITHDPSSVTVTDRSAEISWQTDDDSDSKVSYGESIGLGSGLVNDSLVKDHKIIIPYLDPQTTYFYSVSSTNGSGQTDVENNNGNMFSFTTEADITPPVLNLSFPAYHNARWIGFTGLTEPTSFIRAYVNSAPSNVGTLRYDYIASSDNEGNFIFPRIEIPLDVNVVDLYVTDSAGNTYTNTYTIEVDDIYPNVTLNITSPNQDFKYSINYLPEIAPSTTLSISGNATEPVNITVTVNNNSQHISSQGGFEFTIDLDETMLNNVVLSFVDKANNAVVAQNNIIVDPEPPVIVWTNIDELNPSYNSHVRLRGNATKKNVDIIVYVNNKTRAADSWSTSLLDMAIQFGGLFTGIIESDYHKKTSSYGDFDVDVFLTQDFAKEFVPIDPNQFPPTPNAPQTPPGQQPPVTAGSGIPMAWENNIKIVAVDRFGRSAVEEGTIMFTKCGIGGDWIVSTDEITPPIVTPELLRRGMAELSFSGDLSWAGPTGSIVEPTDMSLTIEKVELNEEERKRYAIDPDELVSSIDIFFDPAMSNSFYATIPLNKIDYTQKEFEQMKKDLNIEKDLTLMIPVEINIAYTYTLEDGRKVQRTQKQCMDIITLLDIEIPESAIPEWLLKDTIEFIDKIMDLIDKILEPLQQIIMTVFVTCLVSWVAYFISIAYEKVVCGSSGKAEGSCLEAMKKTMKVKSSLQWICDRIFCPSVPMINKYIKDTGVPRGITSKKAVVCDSAKADNAQYLSSLEGESSTPASEDVFNYLAQCDAGEGDINPAKCCGQRYMNDWDSACIGIANELDESRCVMALETGNQELGNTPACSNDLKGIFRKWALSGVCSAGQTSESNIDYVRGTGFSVCKVESLWYYCNVEEAGTQTDTGVDIKTAQATPNRECPGFIKPYSNGKNVYAVNPNDLARYSVEIRALITETNTLTTLNKAENGRCVSGGGIGNKEVGVKEDFTNCAVDSQGLIYTITGTPVGAEIYGSSVYPVVAAYASCKDTGQFSTETMRDDYLNYHKEFVVNPGQDLKTSMVCVCLPGISGNLQLWRSILAALRQCFEAILVTGEGSPGVCRDILSTYVCDVIFKAIRCFKQRFGGYDAGGNYNSGSIQGFFSLLSDSGNRVENDIKGRYGSTNMYNTLFNQNKLMTAACLWAFTGTFDYDLAGALGGLGTTSIGSKGFVYPASRRFVSANPLPPNMGKAAWVYHIGVGLAAGTDINYRLTLVCSDSTTCDPTQGFQSGMCDCFQKGPKSYDITPFLGGGYLGAGQLIGPNDGSVYVKVEGQPVRYDTVKLTWDPVGQVTGVESGEVIMPIELEGANPPKECGFDKASEIYRCEFDVGSSGVAYFIEGPTMTQPTFYLGDKLQFKAKIEKRSPGFTIDNPNVDADQQVVYYLQYSLSDSGRQVPEYTNKLVPIITDGVHDFILPEGGLVVSENLIMGYFSGGTFRLVDVSISALSRIQNAVLGATTDATINDDFYVKFSDVLNADDGLTQIKQKVKYCVSPMPSSSPGTPSSGTTPTPSPSPTPTPSPTPSPAPSPSTPDDSRCKALGTGWSCVDKTTNPYNTNNYVCQTGKCLGSYSNQPNIQCCAQKKVCQSPQYTCMAASCIGEEIYPSNCDPGLKCCGDTTPPCPTSTHECVSASCVDAISPSNCGSGLNCCPKYGTTGSVVAIDSITGNAVSSTGSSGLNSITGRSAADTCTDNPGFSCTSTIPASGCKGQINCASGQQCCPTTSSSPNIVPPDQC
ncbi:MAG: hypothetical protein KKE20_06090, partial [Nanoarchaeota archaeon]|nr:hypothetical protein [Nanoarchaeota archaeon]